MSRLSRRHHRSQPCPSRSFLPPPFGDDPGATLLEVLVALVLVALALLALSGLSTIAIKGTASAKKLTIGTTLAQERLEEKTQAGYAPSLIGRITTVEPYDSIPDFPLYQRTTLIEAHTPGPGLQTVTVTVEWDNGAHDMVLSTVLGE